MTNRLEDELEHIVVRMDEHQNGQDQKLPGTSEQQSQPDAQETIHIHYFPDAIVVLKEEEHGQVVDSIAVHPQNTSLLPAYALCGFYILLIVVTLAFQVYCIANPPMATITIIPKLQRITLSGTVQLGRVVNPITISQSQTTKTTGIGHQDAQAARGYISLYNGQFQTVFIPAGTILTGASGVHIITDQNVTIPAGNPPSYGQASVPAHALSPGRQGNIPAYDINQACCAASVFAKNMQPFTGGQDARTYATVTQHDIHKLSTMLKTTIAHTMHGALQGQLQPAEQLQLLPCRLTVTSDHQPGQEATTVTVTASETCSGVIYNRVELKHLVTGYLMHLATAKLGTDYSLQNVAQVSLTKATVTHTTPPLVFLAFQAQGTSVYAISANVKQQIKQLIAGQTTREAQRLLTAMPGIKQAAISFQGFGDESKLPLYSRYIHLNVVV